LRRNDHEVTLFLALLACLRLRLRLFVYFAPILVSSAVLESPLPSRLGAAEASLSLSGCLVREPREDVRATSVDAGGRDRLVLDVAVIA